MSTIVLTDCTTWVHGYDMTTDLNKLSVKTEVEDKETTTFGGGGWKARKGGLRDVMVDLGGVWQAGASSVDAEAFPDLGVADRVVTVSPTGAEGATAYFCQAGKFSYELLGDVGEVAPFSLACRGTSRFGLVRGQVAVAKGVVASTGAIGTPVDLGAVAADQWLYAVVHVFAAGTTITLKIESDDDSGFASPADVTTLSAITTTGGTWATRVAGPITDNVFRFNVTARTGSFTLAAAIGVGS